MDALGNPVSLAGPYVQLGSVRVGKMADTSCTYPALRDNKNWVLMDSVNKHDPKPILYYRANQRENLIQKIYNYRDNAYFTMDISMTYGGQLFPQFDEADEFREFIWDTETGWNPGAGPGGTGAFDPCWPSARPYNRNTFLLIAAGRDGEYGTQDDIKNRWKSE